MRIKRKQVCFLDYIARNDGRKAGCGIEYNECYFKGNRNFEALVKEHDEHFYA